MCGAIAATAIPITLFALDPASSKLVSEGNEEPPTESRCNKIKTSLLAAIVLHKHLRMWLLLPMGIANGVVVTFTAAEFTEVLYTIMI